MSLDANCFGNRFTAWRICETGGDVWVSVVAAIVLDYRKVLVSTRWAISFLLCTDRIGKCSSHLVETPLLAW